MSGHLPSGTIMSVRPHGLAWQTTMLGVCLAAVASCGDDGSSPSDDTIAKAPANSGDGQTGPVGQALANALRVLVTVDGEPQSGVSVTWSTSDGSVAPASAATDADGISATTWTLGPAEGEQTAQATLEGAGGSPVSFTATATAATITIVMAPTGSGDGQTGPPGQALPEQLRVLVTVDGEPQENVTVTWSTTGGSVAPTSVATDAEGISATTWTLGPATGAQIAEATLEGATGSPVSFSATAAETSACESLMPYTVGSTLDGALNSTDCDFGDGSFIDFYGLSAAPAGDLPESVSFTMAAEFDTFLFLFDGDQILRALNDDAPGAGTNSAIRILLARGDYVVGANSLNPGVSGEYELASATVPESVTNCEEVWVTIGISTSQSLADTDCALGEGLSDGFRLILQAGESVTLTQSSTVFDPSITLQDGVGAILENDVGTTSEPAVVTFTAPAAPTLGAYTIFAGTASADPTQTGAYNLTIE
jgi:hypothetical protein